MIVNDRILIAKKDAIISYKHGRLYLRNNLQDKPKELCRLPIAGIQKYAAKWSLTERLLRLEPRFAFPYDDNKFYLSYNGSMYLIDYNSSQIENVHKYRNGMHNPLNACVVNDINGFENGLYYGEYWGNKTHGSVSVYWGKGKEWKLRYTFPKGEILHIHAIIPDRTNGQLLILTGDADSESAIWVAKNNFKEVIKVCGGSQQYRSCCAYLQEGILIYATDTPLEKNYIYKYSIKTGNLEKIREISGPCIYSTTVQKEDKLFCIFATSVEPDSRMVGGWKYRLSTKPGPGVKDRYSHLYFCDFNKAEELLKYKKDHLPYQLFQFGNMRFPYRDSCYQDKLFICPQSIKHLHGKTLIMNLESLIDIKGE